MGEISIKFSGVTSWAPITARVTGGEFLVPPGHGLGVSDTLHSIAVTGDVLRFSPASGTPFSGFAGEVSVGLSAALGSEPVVEIDQQAEMPGAVQAATQARQASHAFEQAIGAFIHPAAAAAAEIRVAQLRAAGLIPDTGPPPARPAWPAASQGAQAITVTWPTAAGPQCRNVAIGAPLKLDGCAG
jgi:hypothetical protein